MKAPAFVFDLKNIGRHLQEMAFEDHAAITADGKTRKYYLNNNKLLWVDRAGVDHRADSLLTWLRDADGIGLSEKAFFVSAIERDLQRLRTLDFKDDDDINLVAARLEYHLTKASLRYAYGQRFGFVNPYSAFNNLDVEKQDTVKRITQYRGLFDYDMERVPSYYDSLVRWKIVTDSLSVYFAQIQPRDPFYLRLKDMLAKATNETERQRIASNMERCRWRLRHPIPESGKRIIVNIPAYHLYAYSEDDVLDMRVVCGAVSTKTPLLYSAIEWMEVNPQWVVPMSIVEKDVARRAGDSAYFARNRYNIYDRATNKQLPVGAVTKAMLLSGKYRVAQQSGSDNSLGRIVFRFKNKFQVFLHYTSNPGAFERTSRAISHGCVRVAKPFELAQFVLDNPDEWLLDRIRISMDLPPETERGQQYLARHSEEKEHKLIGYVPVKPHVPLYIIYHTLWPDEQGILQTWPDVYGYDKVIQKHLQAY